MKPKIHIRPDCGNAPRKIFLKDLNIAFADGDAEFVEAVVPVEIRWRIVGQKTVQGIQEYLTEIKKYKNWKVKELTVESMITHGPEASVSGQIVDVNGDSFSFCDVYRFKRAGGMTIDTITSFLIKNENE